MIKNLFKRKTVAFAIAGFVAAAVAVTACKKDKKDDSESQVKLDNYSKTPVLLNKLSGFENLEFFSLFSSEDKFPESPDYVFGGSADGAGLIKITTGGFI